MRALVIGANGGIAKAVISRLLAEDGVTHVDAVSRSEAAHSEQSVTNYVVDSRSESAIAAFVAQQQQDGVSYRYIVSTIGILHNEALQLKPEKRLEDISPDALAEYFAVNTIMPTLWLKHLPKVVARGAPTTIAFFSARVGSISDNRLGGWYGYRASKAALNMVIKNTAIEYARRHKQVTLISYHPGTVDTGLSKPFQANVASKKLFTPEFTADCLVNQMRDATPEFSPYYVDWQAQNIPW